MELLSQADGAYQFRIKGFSKCITDIYGPEISPFHSCCSKWKFILNTMPQPENNVFLTLQTLTDSKEHTAVIDFIYRLSNTNGKIIFSEKRKQSKIRSFCSSGISFSTLTKYSINTSKTDDILILFMYFDLLSSCACNESQYNIASSSINENMVQLQQDLSAMLLNKKSTDVIFKIESESVPAHKFILQARSPVFEKMLDSNFCENDNGIIEITDFDKYDFMLFLNFLYTDILETCEVDKICSMYQLADKYDVKSLKEKCYPILYASLSGSNACTILSLADLHSDNKMEETVIDYMCQQYSEIENTEEWQNMIDEQPKLALKVLLKLTKTSRGPPVAESPRRCVVRRRY